MSNTNSNEEIIGIKLVVDKNDLDATEKQLQDIADKGQDLQLWGAYNQEGNDYFHDFNNIISEARSVLSQLQSLSATNGSNKLSQVYTTAYNNLTKQLSKINTDIDKTYGEALSKWVELAAKGLVPTGARGFDIKTHFNNSSMMSLASVKYNTSMLRQAVANDLSLSSSISNSAYQALYPIIMKELKTRTGRSGYMPLESMTNSIAKQKGIRDAIAATFGSPNMGDKEYQAIVKNILIGSGRTATEFSLNGMKYQGEQHTIHRYALDNIPEVFKHAVTNFGINSNVGHNTAPVDMDVYREVAKAINNSEDTRIKGMAARRGLLKYRNNNGYWADNPTQDSLSLFYADLSEYLERLRTGGPTIQRDPDSTLKNTKSMQHVIDIMNTAAKDTNITVGKNANLEAIVAKQPKMQHHTLRTTPSKNIVGFPSTYVIPQITIDENGN